MKKRNLPTSTFHIYFNVDSVTDKVVRKISNDIAKKYKSNFVLDGKNYKSHITLYLFAAPTRNRISIINILDKHNFSHLPVFLRITNMFASKGWIMADVDRRKDIEKHHKNIIHLVNPVRQYVLRRKYRDGKYFDSLSKAERNSLLKYGDKHAFDLYHPHLSISQLLDEELAIKVARDYNNFLRGQKVVLTSVEMSMGGEGSGGTGKTVYKKLLTKK